MARSSPLIRALADHCGYEVPAGLLAGRPRFAPAPALEDLLPSLRAHSVALCAAEAVRRDVPGAGPTAGWRHEASPRLVSPGMALLDPGQLRPYQREVLDALRLPAEPGCALSGCARLPCGAGKTLCALAHAARLQTHALVVTNSQVSSAQWADQLRRCFAPPAGGVLLVGDGDDTGPAAHRAAVRRPGLVLCTYQALSRDGAGPLVRLLRALPWGLVVLDEAQTSVAETFRRVLEVPAVLRLAVSATFYREDARIDLLQRAVGPVLADVDRRRLVADGYLPEVRHVEVWLPADGAAAAVAVAVEAAGGAAAARDALVLLPARLRALLGLVRGHAEAGARQLVFCDHLRALHGVHAALAEAAAGRWPVLGPLTMDTPEPDRLRVLAAFQAAAPGAAVLCVSRVADTSIDLPGATVLVQVSCDSGSRNKQIQRVGRVSRLPAAGRPPPGAPPHLAYTLVLPGAGGDEANARARRECMDAEGYETLVVPADELQPALRPSPADDAVADRHARTPLRVPEPKRARPAGPPKRSALRRRLGGR